MSSVEAARYSALLYALFVTGAFSLYAIAGYCTGLFFRHVVFRRVPPQFARWIILCAVFVVGFIPMFLLDRVNPQIMVLGQIVMFGFCWRALRHRQEKSHQTPDLPIDYVVILALVVGVLLLFALN